MTRKPLPTTASEAVEQASLLVWVSLQLGRYPELDLLYHIPNGGSRHPIEAANLKRQGVKAGVPDLCLPVARGGYHGLYIELKVGRNTASENQKRWLKDLAAQGYAAFVCYGWEEASQVLLSYIREKKI